MATIAKSTKHRVAEAPRNVIGLWSIWSQNQSVAEIEHFNYKGLDEKSDDKKKLLYQ